MINQQVLKMKLCLWFLLLLLTGISTAQQLKTLDYRELVTSREANFFEVVAQKRAEFAAMDMNIKANNKAMKQFERWAFILKDQVNPDGSFPSAMAQKERDQLFVVAASKNTSNSKMTGVMWQQVGPLTNPLENGYAAYPGKGRINVVSVDPTNENIMYAGAAAGGVWKTIDGGVNWSPKSDYLAGLGVSDILVDPNNTNILYMATGDEDASHISSIGVFKSIDAGETWLPTGLAFNLSDNEYINDLAFAPGDSSTIFALTTNQIRKSTDSGANWANVAVDYAPYGPFTAIFQTIVFDPNDADKVIVSDYWDGIFVSVNGGDNFELHAAFPGLNSRRKLKLTSSAADPDFFYGIAENGVFRKYRYALDNTVGDLISSTQIADYNSQGGYNQVLAVSPTVPNNILVAGVRGYRSTDNGASFTVFSNPYNNPPGVGFYVHPDHHHLSFLADGVTVINGHDGGVHKGAFNATTGWTDLSDKLHITQPYHISVTQEINGDNFMMGNQDNDGFSKILKDGTRQWVSCIAGDGTGTGIDIGNSNVRYLGGTRGYLLRSDNGFSVAYNSAFVLLSGAAGAAFVSPFEQHPTNANIIYAGDNVIKRSANKGISFSSLPSGLSGTHFLDISANAASIRIYAIGNNGAVQSGDDGVSWIGVNSPAGTLLNSFSGVDDSATVYATVSGYNDGNKVYKSTNAGANWTNITGDLPNIITYKILHKADSNDETLFVGTELGVYWKNNTMANWEKYGVDLPNVRISDLEINYIDQELYVGTFGRSLWKIAAQPRCIGVTKTWNGSNWSPSGAPGTTDTAIIDGTYDVAADGNVDVCQLTINAGAILTVDADTYLRVQNDITVNGMLFVSHQGSVVQVEEDAKVTNNGTIHVDVTTPTLKPRDFMVLGTPMSMGTPVGQTNPILRVLNLTTTNFRPNPDVQVMFPGGTNFVDEDNNDWSHHAGDYNAGEGYYVWPQADLVSGNQTYDLRYSQGTLNTGVVTYTLDYNTTGTETGTAAKNKNASPSVISNPYASAINASAFIAANVAIDEIYLWEHVSTPSPAFPGANTANFNMADISTYNGTTFNPAATNPGATLNNSISTGQGFGVKANASGTATFNNSMRTTSNNNTLRTSETEINSIWLRVSNTQYELGSTTAIAFTEGATSGLEAAYDSRRLGVPVSIYSHILDGTQELGIQGREAFVDNMQVGVGFSSQIDVVTSYSISIHQLEGALITGADVLLIDHVANTVTNLNETAYNFESAAGTQNNRFTLEFRSSVLGTSAFDANSINVFPNPTDGLFTIYSQQYEIHKVTITDVQGRIITSFAEQNRNSVTLDVSSLKAALYFVTIATTQGDIVKQLLKK